MALFDGIFPITVVDFLVPAVDTSHSPGFQPPYAFVLDLHVLVKPGRHVPGISDVEVKLRPLVNKVDNGVVLEGCVPLVPAW